MKGSVTRAIYYKKKPKDAVAWRVVPSATAVAIRRNGSALVPDVAAVSVKVTRAEGEGAPVTIAADDWNGRLIDVMYRYVGESSLKSYPIGGIPVDTAKKGIEVWLSVEGAERDRVTVPFTFDGQTGAQGGRGAILRGPRDWNDVAPGTWFENGTDGCEFFDVVVYEGKYYSCKTSHMKTLVNKPTSDVAESKEYWQSAADFQFVATKLLLADYATIKYLIAESVIMPNPLDPDGDPLCVIKDGEITIRRGLFKNITVNRAKMTDCTVEGALTATQLSLGCEDAGAMDLNATTEPKGSLLVNPSSIKLISLAPGTSRSIRILFPALTTGAKTLSLSCSGAANTFVHDGVGGTAKTSLSVSGVDIGKMYELLGVRSSTSGVTDWYLIEM